MPSVVLNGRTYTDTDFEGYGYAKRFPEMIFTDLLAEINAILIAAQGGHTIQDEGSSLPQRTVLNFVGDGVVVTDNAGKTLVTISRGAVAIADLSDWPSGVSATELSYLDGLTQSISSLLSNKVDKVTGKGLSTEDYSTAEKNKLAGLAQTDWNIEAGAGRLLNIPTSLEWLSGVYVGTVAPTLIDPNTWIAQAKPRSGYWAWIDISGATGGAVIATVKSAAGIGSASPLTANFTGNISAVINPANATGTANALVATATGGAGSVTGVINPANATGAASALVAAYTRYVAATVNSGSGTGNTTALVATASSGGALQTFTDTFHRTGSQSSIADGTYPWVAPTGRLIPGSSGEICTNNVGGASGAYWDAATAANQYASIDCFSTADGQGPRVRQSASADTYYSAEYYADPEFGEWQVIRVFKCVNGSRSQLGADIDITGTGYEWIRLEATGTGTVTLTIKAKATQVASWVSPANNTRTDSTSPINSGYVGFDTRSANTDLFIGGEL